MKILCLNESLIMGGQEKIFVEYLKLLENLDYEIDILIEEDNGERNTFFSEIPAKFQKKVKYLSDSILMNKLENSRKKRKENVFEKLRYSYLLKKQSKIAKANLYNFFKINKYDLVLDFSNILEPDMAVNKSIRWIHSSINGMKKNKLKKFKKKIQHSKYGVVICDEMKEEVVKKIGLKEKLITIYNPFNLEKIEKLSNDETTLYKKERELLKEEYIISVSRLDKEKGILNLIKAYNYGKEKGIKEKLFIVGEGNDRKEIEELIKKLNLEKDVILLGLKTNPYIWIKNSSFFVLSSNKEGLPTVLIESLILGKAIISTACPTGPREILENGKYGILTEVGDIEGFGKKIIELSKNKAKREKYEVEGFNSIHRFSKDKILKKLVEIIEK